MSSAASAVRWLIALVSASLLLISAGVRADEGPSLRVRCEAFLRKVVAAQRKSLDERVAAEITRVAKITELGPEGVQALRLAGVAAEDAAQAEFLDKGTEALTNAYAKNDGRGLDQLDRPETVEAFAQPGAGPGLDIHYTHTLEQPAWKDALAKTLTPAQTTLWQQALADRDGAAAKEYEKLLDRQAEEIRPSVAAPVLTRSMEIIGALGLTGERAQAITELANKAVEASLNTWRANTRQSFHAKDEESRARILRNARDEITMLADKDAPINQALWTDGLARLLTDADRARIQTAHDEQRQRRTRALAALSILLMDEKVALTAAQRPPLEKLMERAVEGTEQFYPDGRQNADYFNLPPTAFYKAAAAVNPEEVHRLLDEVQFKRWHDVVSNSRGTNRSRGSDGEDDDNGQRGANKAPEKEASPTIEEPEDLEQLVSDYLQDRVNTQRQELEATMLLQAEDATRVAALPPEVAARLHTAALGTAEIALASWIGSVEPSIRAQMQGATRESIKARISTVSRFSYGQAQTREQELWKAAVKTSLTAAQQQAWQVERDARARYAADATAEYLLVEFDRRFALSAEQWGRLAPLVHKAVYDYRADIDRLFTYHTTPWYLTSYYLFLPLQAVPEAECRAILGNERYDRWTESNTYRYSVQYWDNLRESHERRLKEEKK